MAAGSRAWLTVLTAWPQAAAALEDANRRLAEVERGRVETEAKVRGHGWGTGVRGWGGVVLGTGWGN